MKRLLITSLSALLLGAGIAGAGDTKEVDTDRKWTRLDYYGQDLNGNGKVDGDEWTVVRTEAKGAKLPDAPARPLAEGETHRWEAMSEKYYLSRPPECIRLIQPRHSRAVSRTYQ